MFYREGERAFIPKLKISDAPFKKILNYLDTSSYGFQVLPIEILGSIYERFLGKTIYFTETKAKVEEKPETRKAGGVYYTPEYIVNYIVENTLGELLEEKKPYDVEKLRVLDPACGSGSFLVNAYQKLLDWHLEYYTNRKNLTKALEAKFIYEVKSSDKIKENITTYRLSIQEKQRILLNNIYGVDLDRQAVEVSKLSLLLKLMEDENIESEEELFKHSDIQMLPNLSNNIKCGNSLISSDFYEGKQESLFDAEERLKINTFNWEDEFPEIIKAGGFDCVIGNPPYARLQSLQDSQPWAIKAYRENYVSATTGNFDLYVLFTEKAYKLLNKNGFLGFIQPHKFLQADFGIGLRNFLSEKKALSKLVHFGAEQIFSDATTYTCLLFLSKAKSSIFKFIPINNQAKDNLAITSSFSLKQPLQNTKWHFMDPNKEKVMEKLYRQPQRLDDVVRKIFQGIATSADKIYVLQVIKWDKKILTCYSKSLAKEIQIESELVKPFLMGKDVKRYTESKPLNVVIFPYDLSQNSPRLMSIDYIKNKFPKGYSYLQENKKELRERERGRMKVPDFHAYIYPKNLNEFATTKIMTPDICSYPNFTYDSTEKLYHTTTIYSFAFRNNIICHPKYYLGIMNSKLLWFFLRLTGNMLRGGFFRFKTEYLKPFPIPKLDLSNPTQKAQHDRIVQLVDQMLSTQKKLQEITSPSEKTLYEKDAKKLDKQIDALVYELYELTPQEIKIVEG